MYPVCSVCAQRRLEEAVADQFVLRVFLLCFRSSGVCQLLLPVRACVHSRPLLSLGCENIRFGRVACFPDHETLRFCPTVCLQLLVVSDLFTERSQFEMMYLTLTELRRVHPSEDEILLQYLVPATCKAAAVLGMVSEGWWPSVMGPCQPRCPERHSKCDMLQGTVHMGTSPRDASVKRAVVGIPGVGLLDPCVCEAVIVAHAPGAQVCV